jgi:hypothetical protein
MRFFALGVAAVTFALSAARAGQPPAEQLLPAETIFLLTVKDFDEATNNFWKSNLGRLWNDEAMAQTREKFHARWTNEVVAPVEKDFKVSLTDYLELLRGQVTFALTKSDQPGKAPGFVMLVDSKDKSENLKTRLADLQKKWAEGGRQVNTQKIRDVEFTTYQFTHAAFQQFARTVTGKGREAAAPDPEAETNKINLLVAQSQSLLIAGTQARDLETIIIRQSGAAAPSLLGQPVFQANYNSLFRDAGLYAWVDFKPIFDAMIKPTGAVAAAEKQSGVGNLRLEKVLPALGLGELKSIAFRAGAGPGGLEATIFLTAPEAARSGLLKILAPPAKDASPPPFVPADAIKFQRLRIDFQQTWNVLENVLVKIDPTISGLVQLMISAAGKDKDPDFDLKKSVIDSVSDDFISYEKRTTNGVSSTIRLIGARNPAQLINGLKAILRMLPEPVGGAPLKEREILGRKVYTLSLTPPGVPAQPGSDYLLTATTNYVAIANDAAMVEEFLRNETAPKPLRDTPGLTEAAQKAGGMNSGWFSVENQIETTRAALQNAKKNPDDEADSPGLFSLLNFNLVEGLSGWLDFNSLPPYERISKYFYLQLVTGTATPEGIAFKIAAPAPPALK